MQEDTHDDLLISNWFDGDEKAFDLLFNKYFFKLYLFALAHLNDEGLSKELIMDVMVRLWQKKGKINEVRSLKAFLYKSVKNAIIDQYRKKALELTALDEHIKEPVDERSADHKIAEYELEQVFQRGLQMLSPQQRLVFDMNRNQALSHHQIAENLNITTKTVENHMTAALFVLRKHLKKHGDLVISVFLLLIYKG